MGIEGEVIVSVRPGWRERDRCGVCRRRSPGYDLGEGRRRWRTLDLGTTFAFVEAAAPRVTCRRHGVVVVAVPWARHDSRFTRAFEDQVCWLAVNTSKTAVAELMRVAWRSVGTILDALDKSGNCLWGVPCIHENARLHVDGSFGRPGRRRHETRRWRIAGWAAVGGSRPALLPAQCVPVDERPGMDASGSRLQRSRSEADCPTIVYQKVGPLDAARRAFT